MIQQLKVRLGMLCRHVPGAGRGILVIGLLGLASTFVYCSSSRSSAVVGDVEGSSSSRLASSSKHSEEPTDSSSCRPSSHANISLSHFPELHGPRYDIWEPLFEKDTTAPETPSVILEPEVWIPHLEKRYNWLDSIGAGNTERTTRKRAEEAYLEVLRLHVSGLIFGKEERTMTTGTIQTAVELDPIKREEGRDWAYLGVTMTGKKRLDNVRTLLQDVVARGVKGDYIETGVWRGGSSIYARGILRSLGEGHRRSFVCDSFKGLPPGDRSLHKKDKGWDKFQYLQVANILVKSHFEEVGLLDPGVVFAKGFFNDTMPVLKDHIKELAVMRLDGDMYESTVDVLYTLYDKLSIGGYVIMDDWYGFPSRTACEDFFAVHGFQPEIHAVDNLAAYWQKTEQIDIQYWRYEKLDFKPSKDKAGK